jgi:general secretion pathway protein C
MNDAMQRRFVTAATLGLIALVAYFQVLGISRLCAAKLGFSYESGGAVPPLDAPRADGHAVSARAILDRNPFDSRAPRPLDRAPDAPPDGTSHQATPCRSLGATLIASFPITGAWSLAALTTKPGAKPTLLRLGETIDGKTVRMIEWNRVVLESQGASCQVQMFQSQTVVSSADAPPMRVDRETIDKVLANPFEYLKGVRIVPEQQNGNVIGIRLFGVTPGSLLAAAGFENGDRLENVNGFEVGTPEQMMTAYARLRASDHLTARVNRAGRTINLDIDAR